MTKLATISIAATLTAALVAGCGGGNGNGGGSTSAAVCANEDGALNDTTLVFVEAPTSGERVSSGFRVSGCSSTFEANVNWRLKSRDGETLASGFTQGGSLEPGPFEFDVTYAVRARQIGRLEVFEPSVTTEGFPAVRNVVPLVLEP